MNWREIEQLDAPRLAKLLDPDFVTHWEIFDQEIALHTQLNAPLVPDLLQVEGVDTGELREFFKHYSGPMTFGAQLLSNNPSLTILTAIKMFAKQQAKERWSPLANEPARVLYFAAIAAAHFRCKARLGTLSDAELMEGIRWSMSRPGAEALTPLFRGVLETTGE
jgi:hypothetical protein